MQLRILLPYKIVTESERVTQIVAMTHSGSFTLLPHRLDCVAALVPGILSYSTAPGNEIYLAIDEGVILKKGADVFVCVRRAVGGAALGELRTTVEREFSKLDEQQKSLRSTLAQLESRVMRRFVNLHRV
jgi:F-type H+-transporting ATPase subunit epsilon